MNGAPRLSIVAASRNDAHGGDPRRRTGLFLESLATLCRRWDLTAELILVEWNPPPDRPGLAQTLDFPREASPLSIRIVTVPAEIHAQIPNGDRLPFFQMMAKNVGIRRARADFVLATNIDLLFSDELGWFLAKAPLDRNCVYRIDRLDVRLRDLPRGLDLDEELALCSLHLVRRNQADDERELDSGEGRRAYAKPVHRFCGLPEGPLATLLEQWQSSEPHYGASGDFTLLSRSRWHDLRGYPELPVYSLHLDSILLKSAVVQGARQVVLQEPFRLYHLEHAMGWAVVGDRAALTADRPLLSDGQVARWLRLLDEGGGVPSTNRTGWGLGDLALPEICVMEGELVYSSDRSDPEACGAPWAGVSAP
jgi:hypothetical protein